MKIPVETFWNSELRFLDRLVDNKAAYDGFISYAIQKEGERRAKQ